MTRSRLLVAGVGGATLVAPLVLATSQLSLYVLVCLATIVVSGLTLLVGFAGQVIVQGGPNALEPLREACRQQFRDHAEHFGPGGFATGLDGEDIGAPLIQ